LRRKTVANAKALKSQAPTSIETPSNNLQIGCVVTLLRIDNFKFSGAWMLEFGVSLTWLRRSRIFSKYD
jgi:hypothetical protein